MHGRDNAGGRALPIENRQWFIFACKVLLVERSTNGCAARRAFSLAEVRPIDRHPPCKHARRAGAKLLTPDMTMALGTGGGPGHDVGFQAGFSAQSLVLRRVG